MSPPFATVGPIFECHPSFPQKINAEFVQVSIDHVDVLKYFNLISLLTIFMQVIFTIALQIRKNLQVLSRTHLRMKVWERGAGPTLACGTGACATVVAGVLTGRSDRSCTVSLPGGDLHILWNEEDGKIYMTGPAEPVFRGTIQINCNMP